ncbi:hypothetical protein ACQHIV_12310 [Kribbella sp. GL6]|uniref:hypothetical protein n=1 Tax=Kribbella sp. GL6 TaxID=3419765 RepID=UPI003D0105C6
MNEQRTWRPHRVTRIVSGLIVLATIVTTILLPEFWPTIPLSLVILAAVLREELRLTDDELVFRTILGTTRIPRAEIESARFDYHVFVGGPYLEIHRRDGRVEKLRVSPKATSTELSGDPPAPDSAAYQITRWAADGRSTEEG